MDISGLKVFFSLFKTHFKLIIFVLFLIVIFAILSWVQVSNVSLQQDTAALVFTGGTVQIGVALTVISIAWHTFYRLGKDIPIGNRRFRFDFQAEIDQINQKRFTLLFYIGITIFLFILCIIAQIIALIGTVNIMLRLQAFSTANQVGNFRFGLIAEFWSVYFFVMGFIAAGLAYGKEAIDYMMGRESLIFPHATKMKASLILPSIGYVKRTDHVEKNMVAKWKVIGLIISVVLLFGVIIALTSNNDQSHGQLKAKVSSSGAMFSITNENSKDWENVKIQINEAYSKHIDLIATGDNCTLSLSDFAKDDGTRFDSNSIKILNIDVSANHFQDTKFETEE